MAVRKPRIQTLTTTKLRKFVRELAKSEGPFASVFARHGYPPMWDRAGSFGSLVHMVLEQQVSLESARAAFDKLNKAVPQLTPNSFLKLTDRKLKSIGFSHQKTSYCRGIADEIVSGELDLAGLAELSDDDARDRLMQIRGIGQWTACVYLMMVLLRTDVWPNGDRALAVGAQEVLELTDVPSYPELESIAERWRPYRSVAARLIWHNYLKVRGK